MPIQISPNIKLTDIGKLTLDKKIEIFRDRIEGWIFEAFKEIDKIEFSGKSFSLLKLCISAIELLAKYSEGSTEYLSKKYYIMGLRKVFPKLEEDDADLFYLSIRNPLYHLGFTAPNVLVTFDLSYPFAIREHLFIQINPRKFMDEIIMKFNSYFIELENPLNIPLRKNFEQRFDFDHREIFIEMLGNNYEELLNDIIFQ